MTKVNNASGVRILSINFSAVAEMFCNMLTTSSNLTSCFILLSCANYNISRLVTSKCDTIGDKSIPLLCILRADGAHKGVFVLFLQARPAKTAQIPQKACEAGQNARNKEHWKALPLVNVSSQLRCSPQIVRWWQMGSRLKRLPICHHPPLLAKCCRH